MNSASISMAGRLPYNHLVFKGEDPRSTLVGMCLQVLIAILDFQSGEARDIITGTSENQTSVPTAKTNSFRYFLMKLVSIHFVLEARYSFLGFSIARKISPLFWTAYSVS